MTDLVQPQIVPETFLHPFRFSGIHYKLWTAALNTVLQRYSCFIDLISTPYAYWIGSKDHICWHYCSITLGTLIHIHCPP